MEVPEVAEYFGIHPVTLRDWCRKKKISATKVGKKWQFKQADIEEYERVNHQPMDLMVRTPRSRDHHNKQKAGI